jgi:hypothetical protein
MTTPPPTIDASFLASQRARLVALRTDLSRSMDRDAERHLGMPIRDGRQSPL